MPNTHENETPRAPEVHSAEVKILAKSYLRASAKIGCFVDYEASVLSGLEWLETALVEMKKCPDCPSMITKAAQRLEHKMKKAFLRRQVDVQWGCGHIKNTMLSLGWWERTRPKK
jgi:hypothetical protein